MFVIKIIYNQNGNLRVVGNSPIVDLVDLYFYIPKELRSNFYCRLTDINKTEEIVKLVQTDSLDKVYNIYREISYKELIRVWIVIKELFLIN